MKEDVDVGGTSASLRSNDVLSVWELLHGLMLPSGNDAANVLCRHFGNLLYNQNEQRISKSQANINKNCILLDSNPPREHARRNSLPKVGCNGYTKEISRCSPKHKLSDTDRRNTNGGDSCDDIHTQINKIKSTSLINTPKSDIPNNKPFNNSIVCS